MQEKREMLITKCSTWKERRAMDIRIGGLDALRKICEEEFIEN